MPKLVILSGSDEGLSFEMAGHVFQIGRSQSTPTHLSDPAVSRVHCEIETSDGNFLLHNISANGTQVNGKEVTEEVALQPGDIIRVGNTELKLVVEGKESTPPADAKDLSHLIGTRLEEYIVREVIATSENGVVFQAEDLTHNDLPTALKVLHAHFGEVQEDVDRFVRAMRTMIPIRHPNLISIRGAGKSGPYCWIAMEYIDGHSLDQLAKQGKNGTMDWKDGYRVAVHVGKALDYAQEHSIVHRNVTPANIIYRKMDRFAKLGDLMLAKATEGRMAKMVTQPGRAVGHANAYMPPERIDPNIPLDVRSDLYSLGATLYTVLAGKPPFEGEDLAQLLARIQTTEPEPIKNSQPDIPEQFEKVIFKLLSKKPEQRYQTAKEMLTELEQIGNAVGVSASVV